MSTKQRGAAFSMAAGASKRKSYIKATRLRTLPATRRVTPMYKKLSSGRMASFSDSLTVSGSYTVYGTGGLFGAVAAGTQSQTTAMAPPALMLLLFNPGGDPLFPTLNGLFETVALMKMSVVRNLYPRAGPSSNSNSWTWLGIDPNYLAGAITEARVASIKGARRAQSDALSTVGTNYDMLSQCRRCQIPLWQPTALSAAGNLYQPVVAGLNMPSIVGFCTTQLPVGTPLGVNDYVYADVYRYTIVLRGLKKVG